MTLDETFFMVTWTILKNHLLELSLTQNRETMTLRTLTTLIYSILIMCEDPHEHKLIEVAFDWEPGHIWLHTSLKGPWPHYMILEVCWDGLWTLSFGLSQFRGHGSCLVCQVAFWMTRILTNFAQKLPGHRTWELEPRLLQVRWAKVKIIQAPSMCLDDGGVCLKVGICCCSFALTFNSDWFYFFPYRCQVVWIPFLLQAMLMTSTMSHPCSNHCWGN